MTAPKMWLNSNGVWLTLDTSAGPLLRGDLGALALQAQILDTDGEVVRFTYDLTDPETGETRSGAARLVFESIPDPRENSGAKKPQTS